MKVTIIGGGGRVGSCAAYALQCGGLVSEIQILDANGELAQGEALDLLHGSALAGDQRIYAGDYSRAADSDIFLITAGLRRKPDESRLDLINRNVELFVTIVDSIKAAGLRKDAHIFVVSNPVDILTQLALRRTGLPWNQVYGLGTMLDTARLSSLIAEELHLATDSGQSDDSWRTRRFDDSYLVERRRQWPSASWLVRMLPWISECRLRAHQGQRRGSDQTQGRRRMGRRHRDLRDVVHAVLLNKKNVLPVSSLIQGAYEIRDICLSVPSVVGRGGVESHVTIKLWPKELMGLQSSARALKETLARVRVN